MAMMSREDAADPRRGAVGRARPPRGGCDSLGLEGDREADAEVEHAARSRPLQHPRAARWQPLQEQGGTLEPQCSDQRREDGGARNGSATLQQPHDTRMLPVREAELAVEWLFRDRAQDPIRAAPPDGLRELGEERRRQRERCDQGDLTGSECNRAIAPGRKGQVHERRDDGG